MKTNLWTTEEDEILIKTYETTDTKILMKQLGRSYHAICIRARILNIGKLKYTFWNESNTELLREIYSSYPKEKILEAFPQLSWSKIKSRATKEKLKMRTKSMNLIQGDLSGMLHDTPLTYYWIGFILADGHISKNNRLTITLSTQDSSHLNMFAKYINSNTHIRKQGAAITSTIMDNHIVPIIKNKFDLHPRKTYNPPNIEIFKNMPDELFFSLICGFIDGDGCIRNQTNRTDCILRIKLHKSWDTFLEYLRDFLFSIFNHESKAKIGYTQHLTSKTVNDYAYINITNNEVLQKMKDLANQLELPVMERKWNKIQFNGNRTTVANEKYIKIRNYISENPNATVAQITKAVKCDYGIVISLCKRENLPIRYNRNFKKT